MIEIIPDQYVEQKNESSALSESEELKLRKNGSGYSDPTAYNAIVNVEEERRFHKLLDTLYYISEIAGFEISERIVLTDKKTGRVWR